MTDNRLKLTFRDKMMRDAPYVIGPVQAAEAIPSTRSLVRLVIRSEKGCRDTLMVELIGLEAKLRVLGLDDEATLVADARRLHTRAVNELETIGNELATYLNEWSTK
jgi:hypothetical protein